MSDELTPRDLRRAEANRKHLIAKGLIQADPPEVPLPAMPSDGYAFTWDDLAEHESTMNSTIIQILAGDNVDPGGIDSRALGKALSREIAARHGALPFEEIDTFPVSQDEKGIYKMSSRKARPVTDPRRLTLMTEADRAVHYFASHFGAHDAITLIRHMLTVDKLTLRLDSMPMAGEVLRTYQIGDDEVIGDFE